MQPLENAAALDLELVDRCQRGESAAWRELYLQNVDFAWRIARRLGAPAADVEDVVHEAFEVAFTRLVDFKHGQFSTWLFRIVANLVSARLRRQKVRETLLSLWGDRDAQAASPEGEAEARHTLRRIEPVLRSLSREKREVFALRELEGLSHEEIAELTGARVETVRSRLFYAKRDFERLARKRGLIE